jgi:DNA polymerase-3 subunit epsilon
LRQRVRAHLSGVKRSAKDVRLAEFVRRVEWTATGGEIGAMLAEGRSVARLRPAHNRVFRARRDDPSHAPWTYPGAIAIEETDTTTSARVWHVVDAWQYFGMAATLDEAAQLRSAAPAARFELSTYRILSERLSRGLTVVPLAAATCLSGESV